VRRWDADAKEKSLTVYTSSAHSHLRGPVAPGLLRQQSPRFGGICSKLDPPGRRAGSIGTPPRRLAMPAIRPDYAAGLAGLGLVIEHK